MKMFYDALMDEILINKNNNHNDNFDEYMKLDGCYSRNLPTLTINLYHKPDDFITIPKFLNNLNLGYRFYHDHHTIHVWETVLLRVPNK